MFVALCSAFLVIAAWRSPGGWHAAVEHIRGAAGDYLVTADLGYPPGTWRVATFPGFAIAIRGAREIGLGSDMASAAVIVAAIGGLCTSVVFWLWTAAMGVSLRARRFAVLALLLSPAGFVLLAAPQSEAIFLPLAIGACLAVERDRPILATVLLTAASATRLSAVLYVVAAIVIALERSGAIQVRWPTASSSDRLAHDGRPNRTRPRAMHFLPLIGLVGMLAYFGYTWRWHGSAFAFFVEQEQLITVGPRWHPATWVHWGLLTSLPAALDRPGYLFETAVNVVALGIAAWSTPRVVRRFGLGYGILVAGHIAMIWFMAYDFASASRYLLGAFPVFALAGISAAKGDRATLAALAGSAAICVVFGTMSPNGVALA